MFLRNHCLLRHIEDIDTTWVWPKDSWTRRATTATRIFFFFFFNTHKILFLFRISPPLSERKGAFHRFRGSFQSSRSLSYSLGGAFSFPPFSSSSLFSCPYVLFSLGILLFFLIEVFGMSYRFLTRHREVYIDLRVSSSLGLDDRGGVLVLAVTWPRPCLVTCLPAHQAPVSSAPFLSF